MDQKKHEFDEMQVQKRDRICRRMFSILSWSVLLTAGLSVHPSLQSDVLISWLAEPGNLAVAIVVIVLACWLITGICLIKAGALVPFRESAAVRISFGIGGLAVGLFLAGSLYFGVALILISAGIRFVKLVLDSKKKARKEEK